MKTMFKGGIFTIILVWPPAFYSDFRCTWGMEKTSTKCIARTQRFQAKFLTFSQLLFCILEVIKFPTK